MERDENGKALDIQEINLAQKGMYGWTLIWLPSEVRRSQRKAGGIALQPRPRPGSSQGNTKGANPAGGGLRGVEKALDGGLSLAPDP